VRGYLAELDSALADVPAAVRSEMVAGVREELSGLDAETAARRIQELGDWRGKLLAQLRALINEADPDVVEEWKWDVPVWSHDGIICTGEAYKKAVKLTFAKGASVKDPSKLFNSSLEGNTRRAIDFPEGASIDEKAFKALIRAAVKVNQAAKNK
jgi:hypothetical protein